jgi:hypothetical protein
MEKDIQKNLAESDKKVRIWRLRIFRGLNQSLLWILKGYLVLSVIELIFFPSIEIAFGLLVSYSGILLTRQILCRTHKLLYHTVSTSALLFFCLFFDVLPLPATLMELKPITYNMRNPYSTFFFLIFLQSILLIIHTVYVKLTKNKNIVRNYLYRFGFFKSLSSQEVWFLILGSLIWYAYVMLTKGLYTEENLNVNSRFGIAEWAINLFFSSYYQCVFIFYFRKFNNIKGNYKINHVLIFILAMTIFVIGIGTNMRTAAITVFANAAFSMVLYFLFFSEQREAFFKTRYVVPLCALFIFFAGPFQSISESMVSVRDNRSGKNAIEIIEMTMNNTGQQEDETTELVTKEYSSMEWDERYLSSDLFNRFCSLKILDETLFHASRLNSSDRQKMRYSLYEKVLDQLPGVIKRKIGMRVTYDERQYSLSDLLYYLSMDGRTYLGGIKIGSLQGLGLALFGYWFPLVLIPLYLIVFYLMDSILLFRNGRIIFPLFFFAGMMDYLALFSDRHFYLFETRFIFRGFWETVIVYIITINIIKRLPFLKH